MNVISFDDMYAGDCVEALYEASQSLKDYVEIDSYSEIFESENPEVKEKIDNNKAVVEKTDNAILRAIKALKNLISRIINSITDFFKKLGMDKGERDAFEQFKEACKQDPSLKNKKITVNDYRKVIANYDEMIKELEATDRDLAMKKETPFQTIQRKIQEKLSQTVQSAGTLVTSQIAYDMARDNKSAARAISMLLKSDNTVLDKLEKDLGTAQTKKYVKDIQCLGKRVSIRRFIINIRHKQCKCLLDTLKTTTNSFVDLLHGRVTADNVRMAKRVLDNDNVGGAIKGVAKTVAAGTGKGAGRYVKDLVKEKIKKSVPEIDEIKFVSIHDFKIADYEDYDIIISTEERKEKDKRIVVIPNILNETGISTLRAHLDNMNSMMIENATPFSPECFILFSPEFIFTDLEVKTKEECLKIMSQAMEEKHVVTENFYDSVMDRESKTTTTIGNGVSLPHGSPTAVNESKVGIAILKNPIMWDNEQVQVVFLLAFRLSTRDEISRIQMFYKEYVTLIDSEEKLEKLKSMKSNIELYKYLIQ